MKIEELNTKNLKELASLLKETQKELVNLRDQLTLRKLKNFAEIGNKKKDIARILTVIAQKESKV
ncbi:MAG: 50S ribosomal protein L29 [Patescibacteria group bacterium]|nr:50S ribosomal protein L29 [Patescibacteria group bacterium]